MTSFWDWRKSEKLKKILENNGAIPDATDEDKIISLIVRDSRAATAQTHISAPLIREKFNIASRRKVYCAADADCHHLYADQHLRRGQCDCDPDRRPHSSSPQDQDASNSRHWARMCHLPKLCKRWISM
jgi:hypothetical protein